MEVLHCVKVEKERGEEVRRALKHHKLLRTDARIRSNARFIYLPLIREPEEADKGVFGAVSTRAFDLLEHRRSIEDLVGFKPSYERIGDLAVLTDAIDETKEQLAAAAIMSLHKSIKVVAKRSSPVEGVFRKRKMKIIAGENRTETMHRENGCTYKLDLEKVYFNPRLASERNRVASQVARSGRAEEIIDMFAGVGSFAVQIAKRARQSHVTAIDINPDAIRYLRENIKLNGVRNVEAVEGDVREVCVKFLRKADRIVMNLPKSAYLFLTEALGMLNPEGGILHFYDVESAYSDVRRRGEREKVVNAAINKAKEKLIAGIREAGEREYALDIREARKVKPYAPYAYIIGIDVVVNGTGMI
jgi:tRNA (guanine37-N1)-methyltransferase